MRSVVYKDPCSPSPLQPNPVQPRAAQPRAALCSPSPLQPKPPAAPCSPSPVQPKPRAAQAPCSPSPKCVDQMRGRTRHRQPTTQITLDVYDGVETRDAVVTSRREVQTHSSSVTSSRCHLIPLSPHPAVTSSSGHLIPLSPHPAVTSSCCHLIPLSPHLIPLSPHPAVTSSSGHLIPLSPHPAVTSSRCHLPSQATRRDRWRHRCKIKRCPEQRAGPPTAQNCRVQVTLSFQLAVFR